MSLSRSVLRPLAAPAHVGARLAALPVVCFVGAREGVRALSELLASAQELALRGEVLLSQVEGVVVAAGATEVLAHGVAVRSDVVAAESARVVERCGEQLDATAILLGAYGPVAEQALPTLHHSAEMLRADHVDALAKLLELVPELLDLIVPAFRGLGDLSPELGQLAERFETIGQIVEGLPGAKTLQRRGSDSQD